MSTNKLIRVAMLAMCMVDFASAGDFASRENVLVPSAVPQQIAGQKVDYSYCVPYCITTVTTESRVLFWMQDSVGKVVYKNSYRPDWTVDSGERPFPGERRVEVTVMHAEGSIVKTTGNACGGDGWGYRTGDVVSTQRLPGGGNITTTYSGGGQGLAVAEYEGGTGDMEVVDIHPTEAAETSPGCQAMRETHTQPK